MKMDIVWAELETLFRAEEQHDLEDAFRRVLGYFSVDSFAYLGLNFGGDRQRPLLISSYPKNWCDRYLEKRYYGIDPVVQGARKGILPFEWGSNRYLDKLSKPQREFFNEAAEFGIHVGLTFPIHGVQNQLSSVSLAWDHDPALDLYAKNILQLAAMHYHVRQVQVVNDASDGEEEAIRLSPRETECLTWAANGKTAWEIGAILSISSHTVHEYIDSAKRKMGCASRDQAIVTAVMRGLITP